MKQTKGFTLIELLVVIAIIGLLASIVIVSVQKSAQNARDAKRMADIKSLKTAIEQYANNNNGQYPKCVVGGVDCTDNSGYNVTNLATPLQPYLSPIPNDPISTKSYSYVRGTPGVNGYGLWVQFDVKTFPRGRPPAATDTVAWCKTGSQMNLSWWGNGDASAVANNTPSCGF